MAGFLSKLFGGGSQGKGARDLSALKVDLHSHLLPALDDGSQSLQESLAMIRGMKSLGIEGFITTPHVMSDAYRNNPEKIHAALAALRTAMADEGIHMPIEAAAEYYIDEAFEDMLEDGTPLLTFGGSRRYLLFETSYMNKPLSLESTIFKLNASGYKPVLAHPERYTYFWGDGALENLSKLYELGVLFQVNLGSFAGSYSKRAGSIAKQLLDADLIDFLGSDLHREQQVDSLRRALEAGGQPLQELLEGNRLLNRKLLTTTTAS